MSAPKLSKSLIVIASNGSLSPETLKGNALTKNEVFIGNLRFNLSTRFIISRLQELFRSVNVNVPLFRFTVFQRKGKISRKYAFVVLSSRIEVGLIQQLDGMEKLEILLDGMKLQVEKRHSTRHKHNKHIKLSFSGSKDPPKKSKSEPQLSRKQGTHSNESIRNISSYRKELFWGQYLPVENRVTEYKRGTGRYMKNMLIPHIRKYICAFLNSEGGRLMIGVDDGCKVYGINCNRKQEDLARCQIDNTIKQFQPHVLPHLYVVDFIPVKLLADDDIELDTTDPLLKVLEVSVCRPSNTKSLYENDRGEVYVRRDGSVEGPLKTSQIVEWCRVHFSPNNYESDCRSDTVVSAEDIILAKESYSNQLNILKLDETCRRIETQLKQFQDTLEVREKILRHDIKKRELELQNERIKLHSARSMICSIL